MKGVSRTGCPVREALATLLAVVVVSCSGGGRSTPTAPSPAPAVTSPVVSSVVLTIAGYQATAVTLDVNQSVSITASVRSSSGAVLSDKTVTWTTSDSTIAGGSVNGNTAEIVGYRAGSATITASVDGIQSQVPIQVRPSAPAPVSTVALTPESVALRVGESVRVVAVVRDAQGNILTGRTIEWSTSNAQIVTGTADGAAADLTAKSSGTATITARSEGRNASMTVNVSTSGSGGGVFVLNCSTIGNGTVVAQDGQYLGALKNKFASDSVLNTFGRYGSEFSNTSIYNKFSSYGSEFASLSAYNPYSSRPPVLIVSGRNVGYITKNRFLGGAVDPDYLKTCSFP